MRDRRRARLTSQHDAASGARWLMLPVVAVLALDLLATRIGWSPLLPVAALVDPTGQRNPAAWLLAAPGIAVLVAASGVVRTSQQLPVRLLAGAAGGAAVMLCIADAGGVPVGSSAVRALGAGLMLVLIALALVAGAAPRVRLLLLVALALLISNPLSEHAEQRLVSDTGNYTFVSWSGDYRFDTRAWQRLWLLTRSQELSEALTMLCLLLALEQITIAGRERAAAAVALRRPP